MGAKSGAMRLINFVLRGGRPEDVIQEDRGEEARDLSLSLQIDEDLRTGKSRMLSVGETRRFFDRMKRGGGER